jgi:hypothetical protein
LIAVDSGYSNLRGVQLNVDVAQYHLFGEFFNGGSVDGDLTEKAAKSPSFLAFLFFSC